MSMLFIPYNTGNPYFDRLGVGMNEAADAAGAAYSSAGPAVANPTAQVPYVKDGLAKGVNVIGIYANDPSAMTPLLSEARSNGVSIFAMGADIDKAARDAAVLATDNDAVGPRLVDIMFEDIGGAGKVAILSGTPESPDHNYWIEGMKKYLASDPKFKDIEIVKIAYGNDVPEQAFREAQGLLTQFPDLKGIIGPTTVAVSQAAQAVEASGKSGQVAVTGLGLPSQMKPYVDSGTVKAFALWDPADMGRVAGCLGEALQSGTIKAEPGAKFTCLDLGERTIRDDGAVIAGDLVTFDKSNIDDFASKF
jgi:rhamnose transport system substrate-binding protein